MKMQTMRPAKAWYIMKMTDFQQEQTNFVGNFRGKWKQ
jgi:hypothetical protein